MIYEYKIRSCKREELIDITDLVVNAIEESNVKEGIAIIYCPHTTAGIVINENADYSVREDIINFLNYLVPINFNFKHLEGNSDAHIKSCLVGNEKTIIIKDNKPLLGTWQGIFFAEFDGPRVRKVIIKILEG
ncbi:secondary thiamine-phosphate synthase enzyme YjbQ [Methanocaldococcus indicus]|uniref:secondary thiamine-phosphate synthase enzyme YjbQ n=1 Tax=Methanocaldococcus indicus TaxID=213231 RepID=UPI003C6CF966